MNALSNTFSDMDNEIIDMIFNPLVEQDSDCSYLRLIDSRCRAVFDNQLRTRWARLKEEAPEGPVDLPKLMERIEGEQVQGQSALAVNPRFLFQRLAGEFAKLGAALPEGKLFTTPADYADLQSRVDCEAMLTIWRGINWQLHLPIELNTAKEVWDWFENPDNSAHLDEISRLDLTLDGLKSIPFVCTKLKQLQKLWLTDNCLTALPRAIRNLSQLKMLDLDNNSIASLPAEIGKLSHLRRLYLFGNKLTTLPEELGDLSRLERLQLYINPLCFLSDRILNSNISSIRNNPEIINFKNGLAYTCASPLGQLHQCIMRNAGAAEITERFALLSIEEKRLIFAMVAAFANSSQTEDEQWGEAHVFDDMALFSLAVRQSITTHLELLSEDAKHRVYALVYQCSGTHDLFDGNWIELHAVDNLPLLADAISAVKSSFPQTTRFEDT